MRVTTNEKLIKRRSRLGLYASLGGVGVLVIGMIASFQQQYMWVSLVAIVVGFLLAQFGNYNLRRWGRAPRPDQVLETSLKGFDDRYHFYAWAGPAPYLLLSPHGVYSFVVRDQTGAVSVNGNRWNTRMTVGRLLTWFAQEGLGNPSEEATAMAARLNDWLRAKRPDVAAAAQPAVVFIDERVQLTINEPTVPVLEAKNMKKWLRGAGKGDNLKAADLRAIEELLDANAAALAMR
jgi:hypothetical protein